MEEKPVDSAKPEVEEKAGRGDQSQAEKKQSSPVMGMAGNEEEDGGNSGGYLVKEKFGLNKGDDSNPKIDLSTSRSTFIPTSRPKTAAHSTNQLTIFFGGSVHVFDAIPPEKVQEIVLMAAASAKHAEKNNSRMQSPFTSPAPTRPSSPQKSTSALPPFQALLHPALKSSICGLQEFPIARRHSLQRFLEKRRDRLGSKTPYPSSPKKMDDNIKSKIGIESSPDSACFKRSPEDLQGSVVAS